MGKYFGTDGFRGKVGIDLTVEHSFKIGLFLASYLKKQYKSRLCRARVAVGCDTRLSCDTLRYALVSALTSSGCDAYILGTVTTPCLSYITKTHGFELGVMITASHNPYTDNGIKIFDAMGEKADDGVITHLEEYLDGSCCFSANYESGSGIGKIVEYGEAEADYLNMLLTESRYRCDGMRIGIDAANGSASKISKSLFTALGADVYAIGDAPNGYNVNYDCGSTHPEHLSALVRREGLDVGFAFDGDADRCIAVDQTGTVVDGDGIIYLLAKGMKGRGELNEAGVVLSVMSNGGLTRSLDELGIKSVRTPVGDRFIYERMKKDGAMLGGEESGHIILMDRPSRGDGLLTAILTLNEIAESGRAVSELIRGMCPMAQGRQSVRVKNKAAAVSDPALHSLINRLRHNSSGPSRIIVRESGTENLVRIMAESVSSEEVNNIIKDIITFFSDRGYLYE